MSSTSLLTERTNFRCSLPPPPKNQQEFTNLVLSSCDAIHETLDSILVGIVEPPAPLLMGTHRPKSIGEAHLLAGDPVAALTPLATRQLKLLRGGRNGQVFLVNTALLIGPWRRLLAVQDSTPTRDSRILTHKAHLPRLHALAWNQLARLASKIVGTGAGGGPPFGGGDLSSLLGIFLKGGGEFPTRTSSSLSLPAFSSSSSSSLLASIWRYLTVRPEEGIPHLRKLVPLALTCLSLDSCQVEGGVITEGDRKRGPPFDDKKLSSSGKRGKMNKFGRVERTGTTTGGGNTRKTTEDTQERRWPPHIRACIKWVEAAAKCPRLMASLPNACQLTLFTTLMNNISQREIETGGEDSQKAQLLRAMGALVLYRQPATLSPALPLLMGLLKGFLHDRDGHVGKGIRSVALDLARSIDLLIRPRRSYHPTKTNWKEDVGADEGIRDQREAEKEQENDGILFATADADAGTIANADGTKELAGDDLTFDVKSMTKTSTLSFLSSNLMPTTSQPMVREQAPVSAAEARPSLSSPPLPRPEGDDADLPSIVDELSD